MTLKKDLATFVSNKSNEDLMRLLKNAQRMSGSRKAEDAKTLIYKEWGARSQAFLQGKKVQIMEADGVLSAFGYHVGDYGVTDKVTRRAILATVMESPIPPINDPYYVAEWGAPRSKRRARKLIRTLHGLIANASKKGGKHRQALKRAIGDWSDDLAYLQST